jgi:hypothetical protein
VIFHWIVENHHRLRMKYRCYLGKIISSSSRPIRGNIVVAGNTFSAKNPSYAVKAANQ